MYASAPSHPALPVSKLTRPRLRPRQDMFIGQLYTVVLTLLRPSPDSPEIPVLMIMDRAGKVYKAVRVDGQAVDPRDIDCLLMSRRENAHKCGRQTDSLACAASLTPPPFRTACTLCKWR